MLLSLLASPLVSMVIIWLLTKRAVEVVYTALYFAILSLIQVLIIFYYFEPNSSLFQFYFSPFGPEGLTSFIFSDNTVSRFSSGFSSPSTSTLLLGIDGIALWLLWLVSMLMPIVILSSYKAIPDNRIRHYILLIVFIGFWSTAVFLVLDLLLFYISFEGIMIPTFFVIGFFGSRTKPNRPNMPNMYYYSSYFSSVSKLPLNSLNSISNLDPWFITGLMDGDRSFNYSVTSRPKYKIGLTVICSCSIIALNTPTNYDLLLSIKNQFGGHIHIDGNCLDWQANKLTDLIKIRDHFHLYPLQTSKCIQFDAWCNILGMVIAGDHLNLEGLKKIISYKGVFKKGLNDNLRSKFPEVKLIIPTEFIPNMEPLNGHWIAGFVTADGHFTLGLSQRAQSKYGYRVNPLFSISQNNRDLVVLERIRDFLGAGKIILDPRNNSSNLKINKVNTIINIIIPFFSRYSLHGDKAYNFRDFEEGMNIIKFNGHLTEKGLNKIKLLVNNMNSLRSF